MDALEDAPRQGRPATYSPEERAEVVAAALHRPQELKLPFGCWSLDRLTAYLNEHKYIAIKRSRVGEILLEEGLRWRKQETWFGAEKVDPDFAKKKGDHRAALHRAEPQEVFAIVDNLSTHRAADVLLFSLAYPRWHFVFQPTYAAYLNLIEPWWKTLRRLALKGRRFETWAELAQAVEQAAAYWNAHRHPYRWGRRRRHRPRRQPGCARVPLPA